MYKLHGEYTIYRFSDGAFIPRDPENCDYMKYQQWEVAGNKPVAAEVDLDEAIEAYKVEAKNAKI
jgi:hypothetical protein